MGLSIQDQRNRIRDSEEWSLVYNVSRKNINKIERYIRNKKKRKNKNGKNKKIEKNRVARHGKKYSLKHLFSKPYSSFLKSRYWKDVRQLVLKRDGHKCTCGNTSRLQVHHKTYINHFNEMENLQDLIILCKSCHEKEHKINVK